ncbi:MAG: hypothetical protein H5T86_13680, partial [Armatimonadetes bacterium]|nr:hypothetical protein [Armatimonadota bacterium]
MRWHTLCILLALVGAIAEPGQGGELSSPLCKPYVRTHDPAKKPEEPALKLRYQPRYTHTDADPHGQPTWLIPDDRSAKSHFLTRRVRIEVTGDIGRHWAYDFQWRRDAGMDQLEWYDAFVTYSGWRVADVTLGQFKTPTERLLCISEIAVPTYEPPRSSKLLSPDRDVGVMLHDARRSAGKHAWYLGVFNGEGQGRIRGFSTLMWAGRFEYCASPRLNVAFSLALNNNTHRSLYQKFIKANGDPYNWLHYYSAGAMDELTWAADAHYEDDHWRFFGGYMRKELQAAGLDL